MNASPTMTPVKGIEDEATMNPFQQTQKLIAKMEELQKALEEKEIEGASGAGLVTVTLNGKYDLRRIHIDPSLMVPDDVGMLEDLIIAAFREARQKVDEMVAAESGQLTAGLPKIPGMPF